MSGIALRTGLDTLQGEASNKSNRGEGELWDDLKKVVDGIVCPRFHFQPIADLRRSVVAGYEALARIPNRYGLPPDVCLEAATRCGIREELEALLLTQAMQVRRTLPQNVFLCVNVSPLFLCSSAWESAALSVIDLSGLVVEITEAECIEDYETVRTRAADIVARGGMVAVDDAGAGYASLKHILEIKPSFIKLDRSLVQNCGTDRAKATIIELLGAAADRMDAWVITEGVETAAELGELLRLDVPLAQGYFLGRPKETMSGLSPEAMQVFQGFAKAPEQAHDLRLYAELCPALRSRDRAAFTLSLETPLVAVVDAWGRPMELMEEHASLGKRALPGLMRCHYSCDLQGALQRALTRPQIQRFDPIAVTDGEGRFCGVVRIERLMLAVLGK